MVKTYLRYAPATAFGVVSSSATAALFDSSGELALAPALEHVMCWHVRQHAVKRVFDVRHNEANAGVVGGLQADEDEAEEVTALARCAGIGAGPGAREQPVKSGDSGGGGGAAAGPQGEVVAVGYADGVIRIWPLTSASRTERLDRTAGAPGAARPAPWLTLRGHRSAVTCMAYSRDGSMLASGSKDTDIVVWDPLGETGLFRLRGHRDEVTQVLLLSRARLLVSCAKDSFVKVWDLDTQHCIQTVVTHRSEVWSMDVNADETILATGCSDSELRLFRINAEPGPDAQVLTYWGSLPRSSTRRASTVRFSESGAVLACQAAGKIVELFHVRSPDKVQSKLRRRLKRQREKLKKQSATGAAAVAAAAASSASSADVQPADMFGPMLPLRTKKKIRSIDFAPLSSTFAQRYAAAGTELPRERLLLTLHSNALSVYDVEVTEKAPEGAEVHTRMSHLTLPGHRDELRSVALSSDDSMAVTTSAREVKVWNVSSGNCIRTFESGFGLCGLFAPGNRHVLVGTKEGCIEIWDLGGSRLLQRIQAHQGALWTMDLRPDRRGITTGGADKQVRFWDFELVTPEAGDASGLGGKHLSLVLARTLKLSEDVLCVKHSPDGRYVAVALLDASISVFFADTLKFFVSLYGHRLPVLSMDISSDSTLLISGSADKNVKIWGLDFGDCHRSLFAHQASVMAVRFVRETHYFFAVGKDKMVTYWDGDTFENILRLDGHHAEVSGLAVSKDGAYVVSCGYDRSIRVWKRTEEQVFLEEEREKQLESMFEKDAVVERRAVGAIEGSGLPSAADAAGSAVVDPLTGKSSDVSLKAGERIMEALDLATTEEERWANYRAVLRSAQDQPVLSAEAAAREKLLLRAMAGDGGDDDDEDDDGDVEMAMQAVTPREVKKPPPNPFLRGMSPSEYVLSQIRAVPRMQLEEALLVLPFEAAVRLTKFLNAYLSRGLDVELSMRCLMFLLTVHQKQIVSNQVMVDTLARVRRNSRKRLRQQKDLIGVNVEALKFVQRELESDGFFFGDRAAGDEGAAKKKHKTRTVKVVTKGL